MSFPAILPPSKNRQFSTSQTGHFYFANTGHYHFAVTQKNAQTLLLVLLLVALYSITMMLKYQVKSDFSVGFYLTFLSDFLLQTLSS
jgi:hypothetical protein